MIVVGLAGGMGQGKSTVGQMLRYLAGVDYKADLENSYSITTIANAWLATWPQPLVLAPGQTKSQLANRLIESLPHIVREVTGKRTKVQALQLDAQSLSSLALHRRLLDYLDQWLLVSDKERHVQLPLPIVPENKALHRALFQWLGGVMIELVSRTIWSDLIDRRIKQLAGRGYKLVTVGGIRYNHDVAMIQANQGVVLRVERADSLTSSSSDVTETSMQDIKADVVLHNDGTLDQLEAAVNRLWADLQAGKPKSEYRASESSVSS